MSGRDTGQILSTLAMVGQLGLLMAACILAGFLAGLYLDKVLGTRPVLAVVLLLAGVGAGMLVSYRMIVRLICENKLPGPTDQDGE